jgi:CRP-like cAMP-binding protein
MPVQATNAILDSLPAGDAAALRKILKTVRLEQQKVLSDPGDTITHVYFPTSAIVSLVATLSNGAMVEAAMVGRDGIIGASAALDGKISFSRAIVQLSGDCMQCDIASLRQAALKSEPLLSLLIRHEQAVYAQAQQSTACIASHHVEARLCRWMLRARDLAGSETLAFTQEFLAEMLGVQRTSVSVVAHTLQSAGFISYSRGRIQILNVDGLREAACECYDVVRRHYETLLGPGRF